MQASCLLTLRPSTDSGQGGSRPIQPSEAVFKVVVLPLKLKKIRFNSEQLFSTFWTHFWTHFWTSTISYHVHLEDNMEEILKFASRKIGPKLIGCSPYRLETIRETQSFNGQPCSL